MVHYQVVVTNSKEIQMAKQPQAKKQTSGNPERKNGKAFKKHPLVFSASKRRLVPAGAAATNK
jgi:hypothetical protein